MKPKIVFINDKQYKYFNGTYYHIETTSDIILLLDIIRLTGNRVRFHWGDAKTGKDWGDTYNVKGRIGRSTGPVKIPILLYNARSIGGGAILDHCIVKITETKSGRVLYQHLKYHFV